MENKQLEAKILGKRLNLEKMSKTSHISETHALIQVSEFKLQFYSNRFRNGDKTVGHLSSF